MRCLTLVDFCHCQSLQRKISGIVIRRIITASGKRKGKGDKESSELKQDSEIE